MARRHKQRDWRRIGGHRLMGSPHEKDMRAGQITSWQNPKSFVEGSAYGEVRWGEWCRLERERIGPDCEIRQHEDGFRIALFREGFFPETAKQGQ